MLGERNIRVRDVSYAGKFAQAANTIMDSSTRFFPDLAGEKRFACRRTAASGIRIISRKDAKTAKVGKTRKSLVNLLIFPL